MSETNFKCPACGKDVFRVWCSGECLLELEGSLRTDGYFHVEDVVDASNFDDSGYDKMASCVGCGTEYNMDELED